MIRNPLSTSGVQWPTKRKNLIQTKRYYEKKEDRRGERNREITRARGEPSRGWRGTRRDDAMRFDSIIEIIISCCVVCSHFG